MKAFSKFRTIIRERMRKRIENEQKRQKDAEEAGTVMKELRREFLMLQLRDAKNGVDAYHARLDDIIRRAAAETSRRRVERDGTRD